MVSAMLPVALSAALGLVHIILASHSASLQRGYRWTASARDAPVPPLTGVAGRLERASRNFFETFPIFLAAVVIVQVLGAWGLPTAWCAWIYFLARVAYLAAYASGIYMVRSLIWNVATVAIMVMLVAGFF